MYSSVNKFKIVIFKFIPIIIFITFYLIYSFVFFKEFPITTDEQARYEWGRDQLDYFKNSSYLQTFIKPDQEPDTNILYPTILNILNPNFYYEWFHLQNLLFSSIAFVSIYFLCYMYSKNPHLSIIGPVFLFLTPNFSGMIASNPIDIPFAVVFILNIFLVYYFKNRGFDFGKILILGFSFWPLISIRPVGAQIFLHYIILTLLFLPSKDKKIYLLLELKYLIFIGFVSFFLMAISWPYLGINFFKNYPSILLTNAKYDKWDNTILFEGVKIPGVESPWYYLFTYIGYTIPLFIFVLFVISLLKIKDKLKAFLLYVLSFNLLIYLLLDPLIYNGMRHFLFIVPLIVSISCFGFFDFINSTSFKKLKVLIFVGIFASILWTLYEMVNLFPNHYAYFNEISGGFRNNYLKYETEYWGGSYKMAAEYIRDNLAIGNEDLKVSSCFIGFGMQYYSKGTYEVVMKESNADVKVCDVVSEMGESNLGEVIHEIKLHGVTFVNIRKNK